MDTKRRAALVAAATLVTTTAASNAAAVQNLGAGSAEEMVEEYVAARQDHLIGRAYAEGMILEGLTYEDLQRAQDGAAALREDVEQFRSALEAIERPDELDEVFEGALEMVDGVAEAAARAEEAGDLEEFTTAYDSYLAATGGTAFRELRAALGVDDMQGIRPDELFEVDEVYSDDLSDDTNRWMVPEGVPTDGVRGVDGQLEIVAAPGQTYAVVPSGGPGYEGDGALLSFDTQVTVGGGDETFSYGAACPSDDVVAEGMRAELGGGGGQTFAETKAGTGEVPEVFYYSYREQAPETFQAGEVNRVDVACLGVQDRTVVLLWVDGLITTGGSFPGRLPEPGAAHGSGGLTVLADPEAPAGATVRFDNWTVAGITR